MATPATLADRFAPAGGRRGDAHRPLLAHRAGRLVRPQRDERRLAEHAVVGPARVRDLRDEGRPHPVNAAQRRARQATRVLERRRVAPYRVQYSGQLGERPLVETRADPARVAQAPRLVV